MDYYQTLIESKMECVGYSGENSIYRCPVCERNSGSGHLYVNYQKGMFNCFKCNFSGRSLSKLLTTIGYSITELKKMPVHLISEVSSPKRSSLLEDVGGLLTTKSRKVVSYSKDLRVLTDYYDFQTTELSPNAREYLYRRGIGDELISHYQMREGLNRSRDVIRMKGEEYQGRDYSGRILIPSLCADRNEISFYVARDYLSRNNLAKYLNPPQSLAYSSEDVWNLSNVSSDSVVICEGVFTAIAAGGSKYNAVATYGKSISNVSNTDKSDVIVSSQGDKLVSRGFKYYIVAYDADAFEESLRTCEYLHSRGANVYYVRIPPLHGDHTDVSDLTLDERSSVFSRIKKYTPGDQLEVLL